MRDILRDPVRRKQYDHILREQALQKRKDIAVVCQFNDLTKTVEEFCRYIFHTPGRENQDCVIRSSE